MKRTEIIIETQRVTVIQRRRGSTFNLTDSSLYDIPTTDAGNHSGCGIGGDQVGIVSNPAEEKEPCTDSKNR